MYVCMYSEYDILPNVKKSERSFVYHRTSSNNNNNNNEKQDVQKRFINFVYVIYQIPQDFLT